MAAMRCYLCGRAGGALVEHSYGTLRGRDRTIVNCAASDACYRRCHANALRIARLSRKPVKPRQCKTCERTTQCPKHMAVEGDF